MSFAVAVKTHGVKEIRRDLKRIRKDLTPKLERRALNHAARKANTEIRRTMAARTGIKQRLIGRRIKVRLIRGAGPQVARLVILTRPMPIARLGRPSQTKQGAKVARAVVPGAFVARLKSGHLGIFERKQKKSRRVGPGARSRPHDRYALPIKEVTIPIDPPFYKIANRAVFGTAAREFVKEFERLARRAFRGRAGSRFNIGTSARRVRGA